MGRDNSILGDDRAVAPLIGFILLFGLATVAFAGYQATAVPQQNAETEFQHYEDVQNDMIVVRNAVSRAGQTDTSQFESVRLGTQYRERVLALNPPASQGTLRTGDAYDIGISCRDDPVQTRFLQYRNGYNELDVGPIYYENSVVYLDERDSGGGIAVIEEQNLVTDDGIVRLTALQNDYERSALGRTSVELYPAEEADDLDCEGDVTIEIPTRLSGSEYWDDELEGSIDYEIDEDGYESGIHRLTLNNVQTENLRLNTVGIDDSPRDGSTVVANVGGSVPDNSNNNPESGSDLPEGDVAFDDLDGDEQYDEGETTYAESDFYGGTFSNKDIDLVIERNIIGGDNKIDIKSNSLVIKNGVTLSTTDGKNIRLDIESDIDISGAILISEGNNADMNIYADGDINAEDTILNFDRDGDAEADGGTLFVNDNGGDKNDGGTYIEDTNGEETTLTLSKGDLEGQPEYGTVDES